MILFFETLTDEIAELLESHKFRVLVRGKVYLEDDTYFFRGWVMDEVDNFRWGHEDGPGPDFNVHPNETDPGYRAIYEWLSARVCS